MPQKKPGTWSTRYTNTYGLPFGRLSCIPDVDLGHHFTRLKVIDGGDGAVGGLNQGVYLLRRKEDRGICVEKKIDGKEKLLRREIHILHHLKHPNVVEFVSAFITPPPRKASLYMEFCDLGSLDGLIKRWVTPLRVKAPRTSYEGLTSVDHLSWFLLTLERHRYNKNDPSAKIPEATIWHVFESLTFALEYVHHGIKPHHPPPAQAPGETDLRVARRLQRQWPTILHRDIKLANVLLSRSNEASSGPFRVVLADFGVACQMEDEDWNNKDRGFTGTFEWMPPELPVWSEQGDVWALGAVVLSLCRLLPRGPVLSKPLHWTGDDKSWFKDKRCRKATRDIELDEDYSADLGDTLYNCLLEKPKDRPFSFRLLAFIKEGKGRATNLGKLEQRRLPRWALEVP